MDDPSYSSEKEKQRLSERISDESINEFSVKLDRQLVPQEFVDLDKEILREKEIRGIVETSTDSSPYVPLAEKFVYRPGDTVSGTIVLDTCKDLAAREIQITFSGNMTMKYTYYKNKHKHVMGLADELHLSQSFYQSVWRPPDEKKRAANARPALQLGQHRFAFQHVIPADVTGTVSYESARSGDVKAASTCYYYQVTIFLENGLTISCKQPVPIQRQLMFSSSLGIPIDSPQLKEISGQGSSCYGGEFNVEAKLNPGYFIVDGQTALIDLYISNKTRKKLRKIKCLLCQRAYFLMNSGKECSLEKVVSETKFHPSIKPNVSLTIKGVRLLVPHGTEPSLCSSSDATTNYSISYFVRLEFFTSRVGACDAVCEFDQYVVGTSIGDHTTNCPSPHVVADDDAEITVGHHSSVMSCRQLVVNAAFQRASARYGYDSDDGLHDEMLDSDNY